ncbi:MAG: hypothetical protein ACPG8W_06240 [Candidatus Promineifilaceae bacterium]
MDDENVIIRSARPLNPHETELYKAFTTSIVEQSSLMDSLGQQLLPVELAIPGLYVTALQLTQGEDATLTLSFWLIVALVCWLLSIGLTLRALFPKDWNVDPDKLDSDPNGKSKKIGIKDFYRKSALYKRHLLSGSVTAFLLGLIAATISLIN